MNIMALVTCHNRSNATVASLRSLFSQNMPASFKITCTVVDDGSTDGTADIVKKQFPNVNVLTGTGSLFWAGGMRYGWEFIKNSEFDYLLVFNDDAIFYSDAVYRLIEAANQFSHDLNQTGLIIGASFVDSTGALSYGGYKLRSKVFRPSFKICEPDMGSCVEIDVCNMNLCLISVQTLRNFGFFSKHYVHSCADFEYCLRIANGKGVVALAPGFFGVCDRNPKNNTSEDASLNPFARIRCALSVKEAPFKQNLHFYSTYGNFMWPVSLIFFYLVKIFPRRH